MVTLGICVSLAHARVNNRIRCPLGSSSLSNLSLQVMESEMAVEELQDRLRRDVTVFGRDDRVTLDGPDPMFPPAVGELIRGNSRGLCCINYVGDGLAITNSHCVNRINSSGQPVGSVQDSQPFQISFRGVGEIPFDVVFDGQQEVLTELGQNRASCGTPALAERLTVNDVMLVRLKPSPQQATALRELVPLTLATGSDDWSTYRDANRSQGALPMYSPQGKQQMARFSRESGCGFHGRVHTGGSATPLQGARAHCCDVEPGSSGCPLLVPSLEDQGPQILALNQSELPPGECPQRTSNIALVAPHITTLLPPNWRQLGTSGAQGRPARPPVDPRVCVGRATGGRGPGVSSVPSQRPAGGRPTGP